MTGGKTRESKASNRNNECTHNGSWMLIGGN